ncbi:hypothetical protein IHE44_0011094 [Lamprotornis superbus]|uniref:ATP-dependent RNA helicase YTHDC2 n=1 Tax=Lamprotornis superbus TaxID=245042 RepID=A0A835ND66_9PASS|nr:hypothetical protein IHE44_0011094 [Lamprotornis superbus]
MASLGLVSKSKGKGANRYLTVRKKDVSELTHAVMTCDLALRTKHAVQSLIQSFPVTNKERTELLPRTERGSACAVESGMFENKEVNKTSGRLNDGIPQVPVKRGESEFDSFRQSLPVLEKQEEIVQIIKDNKIVLIIGETGAGKTTQIPQFILDDCYKNGTPCRVFCTQPRRLAAIAVAERVAAERNEKIGQTIGYQIRLESRVSPKTLVTFCTNDMLLCTLMAGDSTLSTVTHVIVVSIPWSFTWGGAICIALENEVRDEVHERDRFSDFLLIKLRDVLQNQNNLKLIISSAALDANLFIRYFGSCPVIHNRIQGRAFEVKEMFLEDILRSTGYTNKEMIKYEKEKQQVDYRHSETGATALMISSGRGFLSQVEQLISMGASIHCKSSNGWMAVDWARRFGQTEVIDLLESYSASFGFGNLDESSLVQKSGSDLSAEDRELLTAYHHSFDDEKVDLDLIMHLLHSICHSCDAGAILIFLPGYDEIVSLRNRILFDDKRFADNAHRYQVFLLHSSVQTLDQKKILSTNIAETGITVNDVVFVIDSGKVKEKSFDALSCVTMLKMVWISKASAIQRKGRAGRCQPGVCFRLFSRLRFENMLEFQTPELLRMPLQELCLHTKLLAPINCPVVDFLMKAPDPPPALIVKNALQMLKTIDAMDPWEDLTELGYHLSELPVEPHLGKMVLYSVVLKCLDPVLTIACALACQDPFVLPMLASQKRAAMLCRKRFAAGTFSDHMALLRAFQKARSDGWERAFCEKNFLSQATMQIIVGMRTQLLGQLRASGFVRARGGADIRDVNANSENWAVVKAALVAGMYPNLVHVDRQSLVLTAPKEKKVRFHPTSVLSQPQYKKIPPVNGQTAAVQALPTDWLIYDEMTRAHRIANIRCCSVVTPITVALFCGPARLPSSALQASSSCQGDRVSSDSSDSEMEDRTTSSVSLLKLDEWLHLKLDSEVCFVRARGGANIRDVNTNSENWAVIKAALVAGMYPNLVHVDREGLVLTEPKEKKVRFHPTSVLGQSQYKKIAPANGHAAAIQALPTDWLIYDEMTRAHKTANIRCCSVVTPVTVALFCGPARLPSNALQASSSFRAPSKPWSRVDETTVKAITAVLSAEEQSAGLQQPSGIGQRPRPVTCEVLPLASTWKSTNSRKNSTDTELSDSSNAEKVSVKSTSPALHQPKKYKEKEVLLSKRSSDDRSAQSSVKPADSSPCASPSSPVSGKGCKSPSPRQNMPVRYFIMKSSNLQNIEISQQKGIWSTTPSNERKLNGAFWESSVVYLIFSVQGSGHFQGFARMGSSIGCEKSQDWGSAGFGGVFKVEWIRKESIPFQFAHHLLNPWNDSKKVQISRDGQMLKWVA